MLQTIPEEGWRGGVDGRPADTAVASVEAWHCRVALPRPLRLGQHTVTSREYVVVQVTDANGASGVAFGLSRGAPVDIVATELLGPTLIGAPLAPRPIAERCRDRLTILGADGIAGRAASLLELASWDAAGHRAGLPAWRLLSPDAEPVAPEVFVVEGYPIPDERPAAFGERLATLRDRGFRGFKLARQDDPDWMIAALAAARAALGPEAKLTIDALWSWSSVAVARAELQTWLPFAPEWVEDPFPRDRLDWLADLRRQTEARLAYGDETTQPGVYDQLAERRLVDVARVDATTIGGLAAAARVREQVAGAQMQVAPHVFPEIHRHLACAWPDVGPLECFWPDSGFDVSHRLVAPPPIADGRLAVPQEPGLGLQIDWGAVDAHTIRHTHAGSPP